MSGQVKQFSTRSGETGWDQPKTEFTGPFTKRMLACASMIFFIGAALFGIGWGLVGLCPGPVIASLAYLNPAIFYFAVAMFAGMIVAGSIERQLGKKIETSESPSST